MKSKIKIIAGGFSSDSRGRVTFVNDFNFKNITRFYQIENSRLHAVRAFHGHLKEAKYVYVASGSILLAVVPIDNPKSPNKKNKVFRILLNAENPRIVHIPAGYANGFKSLKKDTKVIFFSTSTLSQSIKDDFRYPADYWGKNVWSSLSTPKKKSR